MATAQDHEMLTQVGAGTLMGELMRQYWLPAAMSREVAAGDAPMRLMLLGEKLIMFRDAAGKLGVMDHRCPHRCASLFFARSEPDGIRCVYHGWKYDTAGNCLEMPNVPPQYDYKDKVKAKAYQAVERNGLIWVYMGTRAQPPALPELEPALLPPSQVSLWFCQRECNWLQALEGDIDTSHFSFLHAGSVNADEVPAGNVARYALVNRTPEMTVQKTAWGTVYGARRIADGRLYWRFAPFAFPFWTMPPEGDFEQHLVARAWVPMDDCHTMFVHLSWKGNAPRSRRLRNGEIIPGFAAPVSFLPNTTDWFGRWRMDQNAANDYRIDREQQRTRSYTGIDGVHAQDQAITESMGPITDHAFEHLGHSDVMVIQTRRRLLEAALALRQQGLLPPGVDNPEVYLKAHSGDFICEQDAGFAAEYARHPRTAVDRDGHLHPPEFDPRFHASAAAAAK